MKPADLGFLDSVPEQRAAMLCVATMHPNGYVRESALRRLHDLSDGSAIHFLLIRANDWVGEVREFAAEKIGDYLRPEFVHQMISALPTVLWLRSCKRANHRPLVQKILLFLLEPENQEAFLSGIASGDRNVQRACLEIASRAAGFDLGRIVRLARESRDPIVRLKAAELGKQLDDADLEAVLPLLLCDAYMPVRRQALRGLISRFPEWAESALVESLFDRSIAIRTLCRVHLRKRGREDVAAQYRAALGETASRRLETALLGLGETGTQDDAGSVLPFLEVEPARVRAAAARSLGRLDGRSHISELMNALQDSSPRVSRMARFALQDLVGSIGAETLWQALHDAQHPHGRRNLVLLMTGLLRLQRLLCLLRVACMEDPALQALARSHIDSWLRRSDGFLPDQSPSGQDVVQEIKALLGKSELQLPSKSARELEFIFDRP